MEILKRPKTKNHIFFECMLLLDVEHMTACWSLWTLKNETHNSTFLTQFAISRTKLLLLLFISVSLYHSHHWTTVHHQARAPNKSITDCSSVEYTLIACTSHYYDINLFESIGTGNPSNWHAVHENTLNRLFKTTTNGTLALFSIGPEVHITPLNFVANFLAFAVEVVVKIVCSGTHPQWRGESLHLAKLNSHHLYFELNSWSEHLSTEQ